MLQVRSRPSRLFSPRSTSRMSRKAVLPLSARRKSRETSMLLVSSMGRDRIVSNDTFRFLPGTTALECYPISSRIRAHDLVVSPGNEELRGVHGTDPRAKPIIRRPVERQQLFAAPAPGWPVSRSRRLSQNDRSSVRQPGRCVARPTRFGRRFDDRTKGTSEFRNHHPMRGAPRSAAQLVLSPDFCQRHVTSLFTVVSPVTGAPPTFRIGSF